MKENVYCIQICLHIIVLKTIVFIFLEYIKKTLTEKTWVINIYICVHLFICLFYVLINLNITLAN